MQVNDQISRYQAEFYTEGAHDAFINVQRLMNNYVLLIDNTEKSIENELQYRKQTKKQRMRKFGAIVLLLLGLIHVVLTIALLAVSAHALCTHFDLVSLPEIPVVGEFLKGFEPLHVGIVGLVAYIVFLVITCKIFARRRIVGRKYNIKKAKKSLKKNRKIVDTLTATITSYPTVYERVHKLLVKTKKHPLGKLILNEEDVETVELVKSFINVSEEATSTYNLEQTKKTKK